MSKAAELLAKFEEQPREVKSDAVVLDDQMVPVRTFSREVRTKALARYYRKLDRHLKTLKAEAEAIKAVIYQLGDKELQARFDGGEYVNSVDVCGVKVTRANKYGAAPYPPAALKEAVGEAYGSLFDEQAVLKFANNDQMQQFLRSCEDAGVTVNGTPEVTVKGRSGLAQRICEMKQDLDEDKYKLLVKCAKDQKARVVAK